MRVRRRVARLQENLAPVNPDFRRIVASDQQHGFARLRRVDDRHRVADDVVAFELLFKVDDTRHAGGDFVPAEGLATERRGRLRRVRRRAVLERPSLAVVQWIRAGHPPAGVEEILRSNRARAGRRFQNRSLLARPGPDSRAAGRARSAGAGQQDAGRRPCRTPARHRLVFRLWRAHGLWQSPLMAPKCGTSPSKSAVATAPCGNGAIPRWESPSANFREGPSVVMSQLPISPVVRACKSPRWAPKITWRPSVSKSEASNGVTVKFDLVKGALLVEVPVNQPAVRRARDCVPAVLGECDVPDPIGMAGEDSKRIARRRVAHVNRPFCPPAATRRPSGENATHRSSSKCPRIASPRHLSRRRGFSAFCPRHLRGHASRRVRRATAHTGPECWTRTGSNCPIPGPRDGRLRRHIRLWPGGRPAAGRQGEGRRDARTGGSRGQWRCPRAGRSVITGREQPLAHRAGRGRTGPRISVPDEASCFDVGLEGRREKSNWASASPSLAIVPGLETPRGRKLLQADLVEPAVPLQVLKADIAGSRQVGDRDVLEIVIRAVGPLSRDSPLVELNGRHRRAVQDDA